VRYRNDVNLLDECLLAETLLVVAHECCHGLPALGFRACYFELKERARSGERLSADERTFVGLYEARASQGGWHQPDGIWLEDDGEELSAEDSAMLQALLDVDVPRADQLEFLA
jgi:hypothetical protein